MIIKTVGKKSYDFTVDDELYETAMKYEWRCKHQKNKPNFYTLIDGKYMSLARVLFELPLFSRIFHINNDLYDFSTQNIKKVIPKSYVKGNIRKTSKYNNVIWYGRSDTWKVRIKQGEKIVFERYINNEDHAAIIADYIARNLKLVDEKCNFPDLSFEELESSYNDLINLYGKNRKDIKSKAQQGLKARKSYSKYVGLYYDKRRGKWNARVKKEGKYHWCGSFDNEKDAAKAYNVKAIELFGEQAKLNEF